MALLRGEPVVAEVAGGEFSYGIQVRPVSSTFPHNRHTSDWPERQELEKKVVVGKAGKRGERR